MAIEEPDYRVVASSGDIEYREYRGYVIAQTRMPGDYSANQAGNEGFRRLVRYISGNNFASRDIAMTAPVAQHRGEKIAMTAPVSQVPERGEWVVSFVMPSEHDLDSLPTPADQRIELRSVPPRLVAALRYSGSWSQQRYEQHEAELLQALDSVGADVTGLPEFARYNAPFVPWFLRRNEILVELARLPRAVAERDDVELADAAS